MTHKFCIHVASGSIILIKDNYDNNGQQFLSLQLMLPLYDKFGCFFDEIVCETKKISNFVIG